LRFFPRFRLREFDFENGYALAGFDWANLWLMIDQKLNRSFHFFASYEFSPSSRILLQIAIISD